MDFLARLEGNPVIAALKSGENLREALDAPCGILFFLGGDLFQLKERAALARERGKMTFVHMDLIDGFSREAIAVRYIQEFIHPDGIISTKANLIKSAKELGMLAIQRFFILDSLSLQTAVKAGEGHADALEIMPGIMPKIISRCQESMTIPLIAGGLIDEKEDVIGALGAGAVAVSTTNPKLWNL